jgi:hypothetical protein
VARDKKESATDPHGKPSGDPELGIDLIREQICAAEKLRQSDLITGYHVDDWDNTTLNYVEKAFGPNYRNLQAFQNATATAGNYSWSQEQWSTQYAKDLHGKTTLLEGFIGQLQKEIHLRRLVTIAMDRESRSAERRAGFDLVRPKFCRKGGGSDDDGGQTQFSRHHSSNVAR